jgi:hypothetical protein
MTFTAREKAREAQAEVQMRRKVYTKMLANGTIKPAEALRRIDLMKEIQRDYEVLASQEETEKEGQ